jgi:hypothetical protein
MEIWTFILPLENTFRRVNVDIATHVVLAVRDSEKLSVFLIDINQALAAPIGVGGNGLILGMM